jgi:hypothetical protein
MHHDLDAFERDMTIVLDKLFAEPDVQASLGHLRRRAVANMHASIAGQALLDRDIRRLLPHAARAVVADPGRSLSLLRQRLSRRRRD